MGIAEEKEFYRQGYEVTLKNSKVLLKTAEGAAATNNFGVACSLTILSAEEAIKAALINNKRMYPEKDFQDFDEFFSDHKIKHKNLRLFIQMMREIRDDAIKSLERSETIFNTFDSIIPSLVELNGTSFDRIKESFEYMRALRNDNYDYEKFADWFTQANVKKNAGFYVDLRGGKWYSPSSLTNEHFQAGYDLVNWLIQAVERNGKLTREI